MIALHQLAKVSAGGVAAAPKSTHAIAAAPRVASGIVQPRAADRIVALPKAAKDISAMASQWYCGSAESSLTMPHAPSSSGCT